MFLTPNVLANVITATMRYCYISSAQRTKCRRFACFRSFDAFKLVNVFRFELLSVFSLSISHRWLTGGRHYYSHVCVQISFWHCAKSRCQSQCHYRSTRRVCTTELYCTGMRRNVNVTVSARRPFGGLHQDGGYSRKKTANLLDRKYTGIRGLKWLNKLEKVKFVRISWNFAR
jgi:hypothetical protein